MIIAFHVDCKRLAFRATLWSAMEEQIGVVRAAWDALTNGRWSLREDVPAAFALLIGVGSLGHIVWISIAPWLAT